MPRSILLRKLTSARWHARNQVKKACAGVAEWRRDIAVRRALAELGCKNTQVLVGANFVDLGGTRNHMHCIARYSAHRVQLAPPEAAMVLVTPGEFTERYADSLWKLNCGHLKAVHSHVFPFFINWCAETRRRYGTRWIHTHHNWYYPEFGRNGIEPWQEQFNQAFLFAGQNADVFLCVSRAQQAFLRSAFGLRAHYIPNGVDVQKCEAGNAASFLQKNNLRPGFALFVGRNDPVKNPEFFVQLAAIMPHVHFVIAGQGISCEVIEHEWNLPVPSNLTVLGQLTHAEVQDAIAACGTLVLCSRREGLPTLVMEGMIGRRSVVIPDEQGCLEALNDGKLGFVYPQGNLSACADVVQQALSDHSRVNSACDFALRNYSWNSILQQIDAVYDGWNPPR